MGSFNDYMENKVLDHIFGGVAFSPPGTYYLAAYTVAPGESGGGTEISNTGTAYLRQPMINDLTRFPSAVAGAKTNGTLITFPTATLDWGTVVGFALLDSVTYGSGNFICYSALTQAKIIGTGDVLRCPAGTLSFSLD